MKRRMAVLLVLAGILGLAGCSSAGTRPYQDLTEAEIASATVLLQPPDKELQVEDLRKLVGLLREVVIYEEDGSYTEYAGQGVTVRLTRAGGALTSITAYYPFLIIDGTGYRTEYEPCEALNRYANELLDSGEAAVVLQQPPALTVVSDQTAMAALLGTYSWQRKESDGTTVHIEADSLHPLDCGDLLSPPLETGKAAATLGFTEAPDRIVQVRCWSDAYWSDPSAEGEAAVFEGNTVQLKPGGYVYEVVAQWDTDGGYGGTARYSFYVTYITA